MTLILSFTRIQSNTSLAKSLSTNTFFRYLSYFSLPPARYDREVVLPEFSLEHQFSNRASFFLPFCFIISIYRQATTFTAIYGPSHSGQFPKIPRQINRYPCGINTSSRTQFPFDIPFQNTRFFRFTHRYLSSQPSSQGLKWSPSEAERFIWISHKQVVKFSRFPGYFRQCFTVFFDERIALEQIYQILF